MSLPHSAVHTDMSHEDIGRIRADLEATLAGLDERLRTPADADDISVAIRRRAEVAKAEALAALAKLDGGSYGSCEICTMPISPARLDAMPTARHCRSCAS